ncbi:MAG: M48 family metalloprotease [Firmicutes bacterium]|nr:M48 family metalloprotease [Bacillota bacterium]
MIWIWAFLVYAGSALLPGLLLAARCRRLTARYLSGVGVGIPEEEWAARAFRLRQTAGGLGVLYGLVLWGLVLSAPAPRSGTPPPPWPLALGAFLFWWALLWGGIEAGCHQLLRLLRRSRAHWGEGALRNLFWVALFWSPTVLWIVLLELAPPGLRHAMDRDPWLTGALAAGYLVAVMAIFPLLLPPLMRTRPLDDPVLEARIRALGRRLGVPFRHVFVIPTARHHVANAMVNGWRHPSVYLTEDLVTYFTPAEIDTVVAHECGHVRLHHLWIRAGLNLLWVAVWVSLVFLVPAVGVLAVPLVDILLAALLLYLYFGLFLTAVTRHEESAADHFVVASGLDPITFIRALDKLARFNAVPRRWGRLSRLTQTHPAIRDRIRQVEAWAEQERRWP